MEIAARSGVSVRRVGYLVNGGLETMYRDLSEAILGVRVPEDDYQPLTDGLADAIGTRRRLEALSVQGFPLSVLSEESKTGSRTVSALRSGSRQQVLVSTMLLIKDMHDRLWDEDPLSMGISSSAVMRVQRYAKEQGWYPTEAWTDIDDPDCKPVLNTPRYVVLTEDAKELIEGQGYTLEQAAERLGVKRGSLTSARSYYNRIRAEAAS